MKKTYKIGNYKLFIHFKVNYDFVVKNETVH